VGGARGGLFSAVVFGRTTRAANLDGSPLHALWRERKLGRLLILSVVCRGRALWIYESKQDECDHHYHQTTSFILFWSSRLGEVVVLCLCLWVCIRNFRADAMHSSVDSGNA
jgi:hypothetical protein